MTLHSNNSPKLKITSRCCSFCIRVAPLAAQTIGACGKRFITHSIFVFHETALLCMCMRCTPKTILPQRNYLRFRHENIWSNTSNEEIALCVLLRAGEFKATSPQSTPHTKTLTRQSISQKCRTQGADRLGFRRRTKKRNLVVRGSNAMRREGVRSAKGEACFSGPWKLCRIFFRLLGREDECVRSESKIARDGWGCTF